MKNRMTRVSLLMLALVLVAGFALSSCELGLFGLSLDGTTWIYTDSETGKEANELEFSSKTEWSLYLNGKEGGRSLFYKGTYTTLGTDVTMVITGFGDEWAQFFEFFGIDLSSFVGQKINGSVDKKGKTMTMTTKDVQTGKNTTQVFNLKK